MYTHTHIYVYMYIYIYIRQIDHVTGEPKMRALGDRERYHYYDYYVLL